MTTSVFLSLLTDGWLCIPRPILQPRVSQVSRRGACVAKDGRRVRRQAGCNNGGHPVNDGGRSIVDGDRGKPFIRPVIIMSHRNAQPHVSINEVACYRTERTLMECADPPLLRGSVHPISVLELTNNKVVRGESSLATLHFLAAANAPSLPTYIGDSIGDTRYRHRFRALRTR